MYQNKNTSRIIKILDKFWTDVIEYIEDDDRVIFQWIVDSTEVGMKTITTIQVVRKSNRDRLFKVMADYYKVSREKYKMPIWNTSIFWYSKVDLSNKHKFSTVYKRIKKFEEKNIHNQNLTPRTNNLKRMFSTEVQKTIFPTTIDITKWGSVIEIDPSNNFIIINKSSTDELYKVETNKISKINIITRITKYGDVTHIWEDKMTKNDSSTFMRKFFSPNEPTKSKYIKKECFKNGIIVYTEEYKKVNFITKHTLSNSLNKEFLTIDIETKLMVL
jgi:hypothetical protein